MSVKFMILEEYGNHNFELKLDDSEDVPAIIKLVQKTGGYWADGKLTLDTKLASDSETGVVFVPRKIVWKPGSIFIPLHRIDLFRIVEI